MGTAWADALFVVGFFLVMLIVPWIMARQPADRDSSMPGDDDAAAIPKPFCSSERERRLWVSLLAVLLVIYSTMGLARELALSLRERHLLGLSSAVFLLLVGFVVAARWAKRRPGRHEIAAGLGVTAVVLMATARTTAIERTHLFEYGLVSILLYQALKERRRNGRRAPVPALLAVVVTGLLGLMDERIQQFVPGRFFDWDDVLVNTVSGIVAVVASLFLAWARGLDLRRHRSP